jgi:hypothetical protein
VTDGPKGYGSKHESWEGREWEWLDAHRPDLEVRCATTRQLAGRAWNTPKGGLVPLRHLAARRCSLGRGLRPSAAFLKAGR